MSESQPVNNFQWGWVSPHLIQMCEVILVIKASFAWFVWHLATLLFVALENPHNALSHNDTHQSNSLWKIVLTVLSNNVKLL